MTARVAIVLASTGRGPGFEASVGGFLREADGIGNVVVVEASGRTTPHPTLPRKWGGLSDPLPPCGGGLGWGVSHAQPVAAACSTLPNLGILPSPAGRLIPELWRDGLKAVDADVVAFSTTQMVPRAGWLRALMARMDATGAWGVGGAIAAGPDLGAVDRAVYLQRFLAYGPGAALPAGPSGENALYLRDRLDEVGRDWAEGFWEAEVQRALDDRGASWAAEPAAVVDYVGTARLGAMARQRIAHARRFGAIRSAGMSQAGRWARGMAAPLVPAVLLGRAGRGLARRGMSLTPWLCAVPGFLAIAGAWSVGEALGTFGGRRG